MVTIAVVLITLVVTVLSFIVKGMYSALLHLVCIIAWTITGYFLYNLGYPAGNTYLPTATMLLTVSMVMVHLACLIAALFNYFNTRGHKLNYDEEQAIIKANILRRTKRPKVDKLW